MTTGTVQSSWQQINGSNVLVLTRETGEQVALSIDQVNQVLNPVVQQQNGTALFLIDITDATTPEQRQIVYNTPTPIIASNALRLSANEFDSILQASAPLLQQKQATAAAMPATTYQNAQPAASNISVAGTISGLAGAARLGSSSTTNITGGVNQLGRGINTLSGADSVSDISRGMGNVANGVSRFSNLTDKGNALTQANGSTDDRNFFLSAGNWIDNSLFGSIADLMPVDMLKKAINMIGGCISGLFKTIGYMIEGEWGKVGEVGLNWLKDAAITGALTYGVYYMGKELNLFGSDKEETTNSSGGTSNSGSSSNSGNSSNSEKDQQVSVEKETSIKLEHRPSANSTPVATLDQAGKLITNGNDRYLATGTILNNGQSSTVFEYNINQQIDSKTK